MHDARSFVYAFLIITENGIEDVDDAKYTVQRVGEEIGTHLWANARYAIGEEGDGGDGGERGGESAVIEGIGGERVGIADFYPVVAYVWTMQHYGEYVPPLTGQYVSRYNTDSVAEFNADTLEIKLSNFGADRAMNTIDDLSMLLAAGDVKYLTHDLYRTGETSD